MKILLVVLDALRADFLSCYGYPVQRWTPNIDFKAHSGTVFLNAHGGANTPHGTSMLLTGRGEYNLDEWKITLKGIDKTLLEFFPNHGLVTPNLITVDLFLQAGGRPDRCTASTVPGATLTSLAKDVLYDLHQEDRNNWLFVVWYFLRCDLICSR